MLSGLPAKDPGGAPRAVSGLVNGRKMHWKPWTETLHEEYHRQRKVLPVLGGEKQLDNAALNALGSAPEHDPVIQALPFGVSRHAASERGGRTRLPSRSKCPAGSGQQQAEVLLLTRLSVVGKTEAAEYVLQAAWHVLVVALRDQRLSCAHHAASLARCWCSRVQFLADRDFGRLATKSVRSPLKKLSVCAYSEGPGKDTEDKVFGLRKQVSIAWVSDPAKASLWKSDEGS